MVAAGTALLGQVFQPRFWAWVHTFRRLASRKILAAQEARVTGFEVIFLPGIVFDQIIGRVHKYVAVDPVASVEFSTPHVLRHAR